MQRVECLTPRWRNSDLKNAVAYAINVNLLSSMMLCFKQYHVLARKCLELTTKSSGNDFSLLKGLVHLYWVREKSDDRGVNRLRIYSAYNTGREDVELLENNVRLVKARDRCKSFNMTKGEQYIIMGKESTYNEEMEGDPPQ